MKSTRKKVVPLKRDFFQISSREELAEIEVGRVVKIPLSFIEANPNNPRKFFPDEIVEEKMKSMRRKGDVEDPIKVTIRKGEEGYFAFLIDGEVRFRAGGRLYLTAISSLIKPPMSDKEIYLSSAKANLGRDPFSPIEEAFIVVNLQKEFGWSQARIADELGKSQGYISNVLKYLNLHKDIMALLVCQKIDKGIALQLASYDKDDQRDLLEFLKKIIQRRGGKPIHPNEASLILKKEAEKKGLIIPKRKKRGRKHFSYSELTIRKTMRIAGNFLQTLQAFSDLDLQNILISNENGGAHILDILHDFRDLQKILQGQIDRLEKAE